LIALGASTAMVGTLVNIVIQETTPQEMRGRILSILAMTIFGIAPLGNLLAGGIAQSLGAPYTIALGGLLCLVLTGILLLLSKKVRKQENVEAN
jgi:MFS family permease